MLLLLYNLSICNPHFPWCLLICINKSVTPEGKTVQCCSEAAATRFASEYNSYINLCPYSQRRCIINTQHIIKPKLRNFFFFYINTTLASSDTYIKTIIKYRSDVDTNSIHYATTTKIIIMITKVHTCNSGYKYDAYKHLIDTSFISVDVICPCGCSCCFFFLAHCHYWFSLHHFSTEYFFFEIIK